MTEISRRDFLKATAATAAVAGLGLAGAPASGRVLGANDKINVGFIGCGGRSRTHMGKVLDLQNKPDGKVQAVAVCDVYTKRLDDAKKRTGGQGYTDYHELLGRDDIDIVFISTPDHWHARQAIDAMKAGKDVYLEKPMTYTWQEAKEVAAVAKETGRILQVGAQSASDDRYWQANKLIKDGAIGKLVWTTSSYSRNSTKGEWNYKIDDDASEANLDWKTWLGSAPERPFDKERYFRWRKYWDYSGGIATDLFYHALSHLQIALGPEFPSRVTAGGGIYVQHDREVPDTYSTIIEYPSLHSVVLCSSMANRQAVQEMIRGHEATIYLEDPGVVVRPEKEFADSREEVKVKTEPRPDHWTNFFECVRTRNQPHLNAEVGYRIMTAIHLGVTAFRTGKAMSFDPDKEETI